MSHQKPQCIEMAPTTSQPTTPRPQTPRQSHTERHLQESASVVERQRQPKKSSPTNHVKSTSKRNEDLDKRKLHTNGKGNKSEADYCATNATNLDPNTLHTNCSDKPEDSVHMDLEGTAGDNQYQVVTALFLGGVGAGKTVVFNKITGKQHKTASGGASVTQCATKAHAQGNPHFMVVDTPGTSSLGKTQKLKHAEVLRDALTKRNYNQIFVFTKFGRDGAIIEDLKKQLLIINAHLRLVTVVVTHFDLSEEPEDNKVTIKQTVRAVFRVDRVLFVGKKTSAGQLVQDFFVAAFETPATPIVISDRTFKLFFDLTDVTGVVFMQSSKSRESFSARVEMYKQMARMLSSNFTKEEAQAILLRSCDELVQDAKRSCLEFGKHFDSEHEVDYREYANHKEDLDRMFQDALQTFTEVLGEPLTTSLRSQQKRCSNCGKVWSKEFVTTSETGWQGYSRKPICQNSYSNSHSHRGRKFCKVSLVEEANKLKPNVSWEPEGSGCYHELIWDEMHFVGEPTFTTRGADHQSPHNTLAPTSTTSRLSHDRPIAQTHQQAKAAVAVSPHVCAPTTPKPAAQNLKHLNVHSAKKRGRANRRGRTKSHKNCHGNQNRKHSKKQPHRKQHKHRHRSGNSW